jgi:hypothetical protein
MRSPLKSRLTVEGLLTVIAAIAAYFIITNSPHEASWLTPAEANILTERLKYDGVDVPMCVCLQSVALWLTMRSQEQRVQVEVRDGRSGRLEGLDLLYHLCLREFFSGHACLALTRAQILRVILWPSQAQAKIVPVRPSTPSLSTFPPLPWASDTPDVRRRVVMLTVR